MGNKEGLESHIENFLSVQRKVRERREATEYDIKISGERAAFLRDALAKRREDTMLLVCGANYNSGMMAAPSNVENKLRLALAISQDASGDPSEEILVYLEASDMDQLNTALFPTVNGQDERSLAIVEHIAAINNAYRMAGGIVRPSFVDGFKRFQS